MFSFWEERSTTFLASSSRMAWRRRMVWRADSRLASTRRSRFASFSAYTHMNGAQVKGRDHRNCERAARVGYLGERVPGPGAVPRRRRLGHGVRLMLCRRLGVRVAGAGAAGAGGRGLDADLAELKAQPRARQIVLSLRCRRRRGGSLESSNRQELNHVATASG